MNFGYWTDNGGAQMVPCDGGAAALVMCMFGGSGPFKFRKVAPSRGGGYGVSEVLAMRAAAFAPFVEAGASGSAGYRRSVSSYLRDFGAYFTLGSAGLVCAKIGRGDTKDPAIIVMSSLALRRAWLIAVRGLL